MTLAVGEDSAIAARENATVRSYGLCSNLATRSEPLADARILIADGAEGFADRSDEQAYLGNLP